MKSFTGKGRARTSLAVVLALALVAIAAMPLIAGAANAAAIPVTSVAIKDPQGILDVQGPIAMWSTTGNAAPNSVTVKAVVLPADAEQGVVWSSSNEDVAVVSNGVVTAVGYGTATIKVETVGTLLDGQTKVSDNFVVNVDAPTATGATIAFDPDANSAGSVFVNKTIGAKLVPVPSYAQLPSGLDLTVDALANVPAGYAGPTASSAYLTWDAANDEVSAEATATAPLGVSFTLRATATGAPAGFTVAPMNFYIYDLVKSDAIAGTFPASLEVGKTSAKVGLKAIVAGGGLPTDAKVDVSVIGAPVATYDANVDKFTGVAAGTARFLLQAHDGGAAKTIEFTVFEVAVPTSVTMALAPSTIEVGKTAKAVAVVAPATAPAVTYTSSNKAVATVAADGTVTGVGVGTATIVATSMKGAVAKSASATITVVAATATGDKFETPTLSTASPVAGKKFMIRGVMSPVKRLGTAPALAKVQVKQANGTWKLAKSLKMVVKVNSGNRSLMNVATSLPKGSYRVRLVNAGSPVAQSAWVAFTVK